MGRNKPCFCGSGKKKKKCHPLINENSKLADMYSTMKKFDEFAKEKGIANICLIGCNDCCYDYFFISENEFLMILQHIITDDNMNLDEIISSSKEYEEKFKEKFPEKFEELSTFMPTSNDVAKREKYFIDTIDEKNPLPCMFLNKEGDCSIYSVRPAVCRAYGSCITCSKINNNPFSSDELNEMMKSHTYISSNKSNSGDINKRPYPIFYWFSHFLDGKYKELVIDKMRKISNFSENNYYEYTMKLIK